MHAHLHTHTPGRTACTHARAARHGREYSRHEEEPQPWPIELLASPPGTADHAFYPLSEFRLRHGSPLAFPDKMHLSTNYFNPKWTGLRRLKNVVMLLEWAPDSGMKHLHIVGTEECAKNADTLSDEQHAALSKAHELLGFYARQAGAASTTLNKQDLANAVEAHADFQPSDSELEEMLQQFGDKSLVPLPNFKKLLQSGKLTPLHAGRYWVAVSLAEAETIRRIIHLRSHQSLIKSKNTEVALRYSPIGTVGTVRAPDGGVVFDATKAWSASSGVTPYEALLAHNCYKFFDGDMHYSDPALHVLVRALQKAGTRERELFFLSTLGCRRRLERQWLNTPLAKAFVVPDEWRALKQRSQASFIREALKAKGKHPNPHPTPCARLCTHS